MKRLSMLVVLVPLSLAAAPAASPQLEAMFPRRGDVFVEGPGVSRLSLPPEVLAEVEPDLSDVRLLDAAGREIPYAIDGGGEAERWVSTTVTPRVSDFRREEARSELGPTQYTETIDLDVPPAPPGGRWELVLVPSQREYVARVRIEDAGGRRLADAPLVKLPSLSRDHDAVVLPAGVPATLRVTIESRDGFLSPAAVLKSRPLGAESEELEIPLAISRTETERGVSVFVLERPRGLVPGSLRLRTTTPVFDRPVAVWDEGAGRHESLLGSARVARVDARGTSVEELEVELGPAGGEQLRVRITDGDSPALERVAFTAVVRRPALLFYADGGAATLAFGGGRVRAPRYDLAALAPYPGEMSTGVRAAAQPLFSGRAARAARLSGLRVNDAWRDTPSLGFAQRAGADVDSRRFSHRRVLSVTPSEHGLARLRVGPEDAAIARPDLADLRVVDADGRQWPYLLETNATREWVELPKPEPMREGRSSHYVLTLPVTPFSPDQLEIDSPVAFFDRAVRVRGMNEQGSELSLATSRLYRRAEDPRPVTVDLGASRVTALTIEVEDGDDAPIPLEVRIRVPVHDLYLVAPQNDYTLLLGDPSGEAPRYELAHVRGVVLASPSSTVDPGALETNPRFKPRSRFTGSDGLQAGVWVALLASIAVLLGLTIRLVRTEQPAAGATAPAPPVDPPAAPPVTPPNA